VVDENDWVSLGLTPKQADLWRTTVDFCEGRVAPDSIYSVLHRECFNLFPDEMFADLFTDVGRRSVPPMCKLPTRSLCVRHQPPLRAHF